MNSVSKHPLPTEVPQLLQVSRRVECPTYTKLCCRTSLTAPYFISLRISWVWVDQAVNPARCLLPLLHRRKPHCEAKFGTQPSAKSDCLVPINHHTRMVPTSRGLPAVHFCLVVLALVIG